MMLKLKLQYVGHLMGRVDSLEKTLMLGGIEGRTRRGDRGWDGWMASLTRWTWIWVNSRNWWWTGKPGVLRFMGWQRVGHDWATELNWTELNNTVSYHQNVNHFLNLHKQRVEKCQKLGVRVVWGSRERLIKGYILSVIRWVRPKLLMYNMVTIVDNTVLITWNFLIGENLNVLKINT